MLGLEPAAASVAFIAVATLGLLVAACAHLVGRTLRSRRERSERNQRVAWGNRWIDVVFADAQLPPGPLSAPAVDSLLDLRESLTGEAAETVAGFVHSYGIDTRLIDRLSRARTARSEERIDVLERLSRARSSAAVPSLLVAAADERSSIRLMGVRALARSVAALPTHDERKAVAPDVTRVLNDAKLSSIALGEAMELLGPAAEHVVAEVFARPAHYGNRLVIAALAAIGRSGLAVFADDVVRFASSRRADVRLAALRALTRFERLPAAAAPILERAFSDRHEGIRIEAARAARLLEKKTAISHLEELLTDQDWTVRRVAATSLAALGGPGVRTLIATSLVHGDTRARNIATQVLVESRSAAELQQEPEKVG